MSHLANYLDATDRSIEAWLKGARTPMKQEEGEIRCPKPIL